MLRPQLGPECMQKLGLIATSLPDPLRSMRCSSKSYRGEGTNKGAEGSHQTATMELASLPHSSSQSKPEQRDQGSGSAFQDMAKRAHATSIAMS
ncbi:hypothetical protein NDU88_005109 [Pleurodeles waltl]|uniref:Uncharacterized protein n=1 Tax=Pleurodeles waltl TaxID=8319 RepID=A0AAV7N4X2_PLEWA|nr:hypothetical protein NDU88_005109 [Pleurodeles waltl]